MNRGEIRSEVLVRLGKDTTSAWTSEAIMNDWVNQAHRWAAGVYKWPFTEGRVSTTYASLVTDEDGLLRGEYPEGWKPDSIRILTVGGQMYDKKEYSQYRRYYIDNPQDSKKFFTDFGLSYYVNSNAGSGTVTAWGQFRPADIGDGDENDLANTVFSGNAEGEQAIIEEAIAYTLRRDGKLDESSAHHQLSVQHLITLRSAILEEQAQYQTTGGEGMFKRIDVLGGALRDDLFRRDQFY